MKHLYTFFLLFLVGAVSHQLQAQCNATFSFTQGACPTDAVAFTSNADPATVLGYQWNFGDALSGLNNSSALANPSHVFNSTLTAYSVSLTVTDTSGTTCTSTQVVQVAVATPIVVTVDSTFKCIPNSSDTLFTPTFTIDVTQTPLSQGPFTWNFGNGQTITTAGATAQANYDCYGTYTVTVSAAGATCPGYAVQIPFYTDPIAVIELISQPIFCEQDTICAINKSTPSCGNVEYYLWDWGNYGPQYATVGQDTQCHVFDLRDEDLCTLTGVGFADGVKLTAVNGCFTHFTNTQITIKARPQASFSFPQVNCTPNALVPFFNSTCPSHTFITDPSIYVWDFGDPASGAVNNTSTLPNPTHTYTTPGNYTVTLIATNGCGSDTATEVVTITAFPVANAIADTTQGCVGNCIDFTNQTTPAVGVNYLWEINPPIVSFGNGTDSSSFEPQICFLTPDTFTITMTATNICGTDTWTEGINIYLQPFLELDSLPDSCGTFVAIDSFGLSILDFGSAVTDTNWTFSTGTPGIYNGPIPPTIEFGPGTHTVTIDATNACGVGSVSRAFTIDTLTDLTVSADTIICASDTGIQLSGSPGPGYWTGAGVDSSGFFIPPDTGIFELVFNFEATRCFVYDTVQVTVVDTPTVTAMGDISQCIGQDTITLVAGPTGGFWTGPNLINGNQFVTDTAGTFVFTYSYSDAISTCPGTDAVVITIFDLPPVSAGSDTTYCLVPDPQQLPTPSPSGGVWQGTGVTNPLAGIYRPDLGGTGVDTLTYTYISPDGCTGIDTLLVTVVVGDSAIAGPGDTLCINAGIDTLAGFSPVGGVFSGPGIIGTSAAYDPLQMTPGILNPIIYTVAPSTSCEAVDTTFIFVLDSTITNAGPDLIVCESTDPFFLTGFLPLGGIWNGLGVNPITGEYDPSLVLPGTIDTVFYSITNADGCPSQDFRTILVDSLPSVDFIPVLTGCIGNPIPFTPLSPSAVSLTWNYGDGTASTSSATHTYADTGTYTITLIAANASGCVDSALQTIVISEPPVPAFTLSTNNGCAPLPVTLTDLSNPAGGTYFWDFGNGQTSTLPSPGTVIFQQGQQDTTYYISLTIVNDCDSVTVTDSVLVRPQPQVDFGPSVLSGCSILPVDFANVTVGNPDNFFWYLDVISPGTQFSTDSIPPTQFLSHLPDTGSTTYTIFLVATNTCGADTLSQQVTVVPNTIDAFFNSDVTAGCAPLTVQFNGFSGAPFIGWSIDGTQPTTNNPTYTFVNPGIYTVFHYANNGCSYDTNSTQITVFPAPVVDFNPDTSIVCQGAALGFTNLSVGTTGYLWEFGNGDTSNIINPSYSYDSAGTYTVTLTALSDTNACPASHTETVTVLPPPPASFGLSDTAGCPQLLIQTTNTPGNLNYFWDFGDGSGPNIQQNPSHLYTQSGTFTLSLTTTNAQNCSNDTSALIRVHEVPTSDFSTQSDTLCDAASLVQFTNESGGINTPLAYLWNFGDGNTSTAIDTAYSYNATGTFNVSLTATNTFGCSDVFTQAVTILPQPTAGLAADSTQGCFPFTVNFTNQSTGYNNWNWLIDGNTITTLNPSYTFTAAGTYTVILAVDADGFCFDTTSVIIEVAEPPVSDFGMDIDEFCGAPATVQFSDSSQSSLPLTYFWDFGDGNTSTLQNPTNAYQSVGIFTVSLTITNPYGCTDLHTDTVIVHPQPVAAIGADSLQGCFPFTVNFTNQSTDYSNWAWLIDGNVISTLNPSYTFTSAGTYTVVLGVDTAGFCFDTTSVVIEVAEPPVSDFGIDIAEFCGAPATVQFSDSSQSSLPLTYFWDFGDGNTSTLQNPTNTYSSIGIFTVSLSITNPYGCTDLHTDTVVIHPQPVAVITADSSQGCFPFTVNFTNQSTDYSNWAWLIDGNVISTLNPSYTFTSAGTYTVVLGVDTAGFCFDTTSVIIEVAEPPVSDFGIDIAEFCGAPATVQFSDSSQSSLPLTYFWDFGDGNTSTLQNPTNTYSSIGIFTVSLSITNPYGCTDLHTDTVVIHPQPVAAIGADSLQGCFPFTVNFTNQSTDYSNWAWLIDGNVISTLNPSYTFTSSGTYTVVLGVDTAGFCFDTTSIVITVAEPPMSDFGIVQDEYCGAPATVQFTDNSQSSLPLTYFWDFGDGDTLTTLNPNPGHTYLDTGHFVVQQIITNTLGCTATHTDTVFVYPQPQAAFVADSLTGCVPFFVQFTDQSVNASGWQWFVDGSPFSTAQNPDFTFLLPDVSYTIQLVADTAGFCFDTTSLTIITASPPLADFSISGTQFCGGPTDPIQFTDLSQSTLPLTWSWDFGDGAGTSVLQNPVYIYDNPGVYPVNLQIINSFGCRDSLVDTVYVYPQPEAIFAPDPQQGCTPLLVNFDNQSTGFSQAFWRFGDGNISTLPDPSHTYFITDTSLTVTLVVDTADFCFDSTTAVIEVGSAPVADFEASLYEACGSATVTFTNLSTSARLPISYAWQFGNGDSSSLVNPTVTYSVPGEYEVRLIVVNSYGCADTTFQQITIFPQAEALFAASPDQGCQPLNVQFTDLSTNATQWRWDLGDGTQSDLQNPFHIYSQIGNYTVSLIASYEGECADTITFPDLITVNRTPVANFSYTDSSQQVNGQNDGTISFSNASFFADVYAWDFGDGTTTDEANPVHQYLTNEVFTVTLIASTFSGCSDTMTVEIAPMSFGDLHIPNALAPFAGNQPTDEFTIFLPKGIGLKEYHIAIYTIWGDLVWESTALEDGQPSEWWDGRINGQVANSDVFVWKVHKAVFENDERWRGRREGSVTLIR